MAYEPTNWQTGDIVTAEKLNKLEGAVASTCLYGQITDVDNGNAVELNIKARVLLNAIESGIPVFAKYSYIEDEQSVTDIYSLWNIIGLSENAYRFNFMSGSAVFNLEASSLDDYPKEEWEMH